MHSKQQGFTLIELVMVIVIIGVLAAVAVPKYIDMQSDAKASAVAGVAGALSSAAAVNFAARTVNATRGVAVANCTDVASALEGGLPANYAITAAAVTAGASKADCVVAAPGGSPTANFTAIGIN